MKKIYQKIGFICVWWGAVFLLKHDLSVIQNRELPQLTDLIRLQPPAVVLLLEDD
ncbi:MAG: hypothetical protein IJ532_02770 [Alphaproteobacteria bacterium]|nr:hypothetical protein [Alphaproteobacteria bacterium]